jgi:thioredoxin-related protein
MTQKKSNTQKFKSISTGQPCNAGQYIAEMICIRKAERENKGSLGYKFWKNGENYEIQVRVAHKLINKYGERAVLYYLNSSNGSNIYSLGFLHKSKKFVLALKFVEDGIKKAKKITDAEDAKPKKVAETPKEYKPKKSLSSKKSLLSKLRKADGSS